MQYRQTKKIIIDERKLSILIRCGCPDKQLLDVIKTGKFEKTGDDLIDEILECLCERKEFKNWGGNHNPKGINGYKIKKKEGQLDLQLDSQVVDKDIDIDIDKDNNNSIKEGGLRGKPLKEEEFEEFWKAYTPIKSSDGKFVAKGSRSNCFKKYQQILKKGENHETIMRGLEQYLTYCRKTDTISCGAEVFLNQRRWENDYSGCQCVDSTSNHRQREPVSIVKIANELSRESKYDESNSVPF